MNEQEKISKFRMASCVAMLLWAVGINTVLAVLYKVEADILFCSSLVIVCLLSVLIFELVYERPRGMIGNNPQTDYKRVLRGFLICGILTVAFSFLPSHFRPVMLVPLIMIAFSNTFVAYLSAVVWICVLVLNAGCGIFELLSAIILVSIAGTLAKSLKNIELRIYMGVMLGVCHVLVSIICYYLTYQKITFLEILYGAVGGIIIAIYAIYLFPKEEQRTEASVAYHYEEILAENYIEVREIRNYSPTEYRHARRVSDICYKYAATLGLKANLAAAAGFYYRLGTKRAAELCFSEELITIIGEYNGEENLPSSPESALVHIVDAMLIKLELLEAQLGTSQWNREVLIYQALNEFSSSGLYDKSGLSINAFLKVREMLAKEELLS